MSKAKLIQVADDEEDFSDVIGVTGELQTDCWPGLFKVNGDTIVLLSQSVTKEDDIVKVSTAVGDTFTFRLLGA